MHIHDEVLASARRICRNRGNWTFTPEEVVRALPHLNESSVRTHIVSRCCVNAPKNHPHKWNYFRRVSRGTYEIEHSYRLTKPHTARSVSDRSLVAETAAPYSSVERRPTRNSIHAVLARGEKYYVAECLEIAVVTQGRTLDELMANLKEAVSLYLEGEDMQALGLANSPKLVVTYETPALADAP